MTDWNRLYIELSLITTSGQLSIINPRGGGRTNSLRIVTPYVSKLEWKLYGWAIHASMAEDRVSILDAQQEWCH